MLARIRLMVPVLLALGCAGVASATPCTVGTLSSYLSLGSTGCEVGDKTFSGFLYGSDASGTGIAVDADDITITPLDTPSNNPGLSFSSSGWVISGIGSVYSSISFVVAISSGNMMIQGASLESSGIVLSASADVNELVCPGILPCQNLSNSLPGLATSSITFTPSLSVSVVKEIVVQSGSEQGAAVLGSFDERFSQTEVPEPATFALFGSALAGLALLRRRR